MNRTVFRQIPNGSRLLAVGNFFRAPTPAAEWRLAALFERNGKLQLQRFAQEMSCVLAVGREFLGEEGAPYRPSGFKKTVVLPAIDTWRERQLGECPRLARRLADRFSLLREILEQITQESGVALVALEVRPLPPVPRCSYHMIDHEKSRCYLLARFKLQNGDQRYLLEIDTSDNRKTMSTRIMGFKAGVEAGKCIDRILRETVKGSLRWPGTMAKYCEPLHSVHHPKEGPPDAYQARVSGWKQRIRAALI